MADLSPTARALRALDLLRARPGATALEIAERLAVTERAARRYIAILREAGIPVEATRGRYGGYRLGPGTRLPVLFTAEEALGLVMAVLQARPSAGGGQDDVGSALTTLIAALPEHIRPLAGGLRDFVSTAPDQHAAPPVPAITSALVMAAASGRVVRLGYRDGAGRQWQGEVDPWAVVVRHGYWYLLCFSHHAGAVRSYRVDRVRLVEPTGALFTPPDDLEPLARLEESLGEGWQYRTRVVFDAALEDVSPWVRRPMGRLESLSATQTLLVGTTGNPTAYAQEWLAPIPYDYRVDGGDELRAAVATLGSRCTAAVR